MKVAIYARCSTGHQSPEMQIQELREYVNSRGFTLFDEYVDTGISGSKADRPELNRMMNDARRKRFNCVLVWRFDRFARSTQHLIAALNEFNNLKIDFISLTESIDTSTYMGRFVFTLFAAIGELERCMIRERIVAGMKSSKKKIGRRKTWVDKQKIFHLRKKGQSIRQIANKLKVSIGTVHGILKDSIS